MPLTSRTKIQAELLGSLGWRAPFQYQRDLPASVADVFEVPIASGSVHQPVLFPTGLTTITTLWVTGHRPFSVTLGEPASNQAKPLQANGVIGFMGGSLPVANAVSISYSAEDGEALRLFVYVAGV